MLTKVEVSNFKRIGKASIELGSAVVFVGPNNSGKTTALQALALWGAGLKAWVAERGRSKARERTGVTINRRELIALPVPDAKMSKNSRILRILRMHGHDLKLAPSVTVYQKWGKGPKHLLRFSKTGDPNIETAYSTHLVWPGKELIDPGRLVPHPVKRAVESAAESHVPP